MINIITPCSRPQNLPELGLSINTPCKWWVVMDSDTKPQGDAINYLNIKTGNWGNAQRNLAIENIKDGWLYFLDDDNIMHPNFNKLLPYLDGKYSGILFAQQTEMVVREPHPEIGKIDMGQCILKRELIGDHRFGKERAADGFLIQKLYNEHKDQFLILNDIFSYYNKLRWGEFFKTGPEKHAPIEGLNLAQNTHIEHCFSLLVNSGFVPDCVIELGTLWGGFSVFLAQRFKKVITIDNRERDGWTERMLAVFKNYSNLEFHEMDIYSMTGISYIASLITMQGRVLLLCDGGNKPKEVNQFSRFLKKGDVIMAHDYARNREYFKKNIELKYWNRIEIQDSDIEQVWRENGIEHYLREETEKAAWLCGIKK